MRKREQEQEQQQEEAFFLFKVLLVRNKITSLGNSLLYTYLGSELILSSSSVFFSSSSPMTKCASLQLTNTKEVTRIRARSRKVLVDASVKEKFFNNTAKRKNKFSDKSRIRLPVLFCVFLSRWTTFV